MTPLKKGDYVLATKYSDGDPWDGYAIGFYDAALDHFGEARHLVVDGDGKQYRRGGFRRCERISPELGNWLIANAITFEGLSRIKPLNMWRYRQKRLRLECEAQAGDPLVQPYREQIMREALARLLVREDQAL